MAPVFQLRVLKTSVQNAQGGAGERGWATPFSSCTSVSFSSLRIQRIKAAWEGMITAYKYKFSEGNEQGAEPSD